MIFLTNLDWSSQPRISGSQEITSTLTMSLGRNIQLTPISLGLVLQHFRCVKSTADICLEGMTLSVLERIMSLMNSISTSNRVETGRYFILRNMSKY